MMNKRDIIRCLSIVVLVIMPVVCYSAEPYSKVLGYQSGANRGPLTEIEATIRGASTDRYREIEARLIATITNANATTACKQWACRKLRYVGSKASLQMLAILLNDQRVSHFALMAIVGIEGDEANEAIRRALKTCVADARISMINALGMRRDIKAIQPISLLLNVDDLSTSIAAITALGRIGTVDSLKVLQSAGIRDSLKTRRDLAVIECGYSLVEKAMAVDIANAMMAKEKPQIVRNQALALLFGVAPAKATKMAIAILDSDESMAPIAGHLLARSKEKEVTQILHGKLSGLRHSTQLVVIGALVDRGDITSPPELARLLDDANCSSEVQLAVIHGLEKLGGKAAEVKAISRFVLDKRHGDSVARVLERMTGKFVTEAIAKIVRGDGSGKQRARLLQIVGKRDGPMARKIVLSASLDEAPEVRRAAYGLMGQYGHFDDLASMVSMLIKEDVAGVRNVMARSIFDIAKTQKEANRTRIIIEAMAKADGAALVQLLKVLGRLGGKESLAVVGKHATGDNADVSKQAIKILAQWPDNTALSALLDIARNDKDPTRKILALRGFIDIAGNLSSTSPDQSVAFLVEAMKIADRTDEKKAVILRLSDVASEKTLEIVKQFAGEAELKRAVAFASWKIQCILSMPVVTASKNNDSAWYAIDGDRRTRWDTGQYMKGGEWVKIIFRDGPKKLQRLTMTLGESVDDYPRRYRVYVQAGGEDAMGKTPVYSGRGRRGRDVVITFAKPKKITAIKIVQVGQAARNYWSIHELKFD